MILIVKILIIYFRCNTLGCNQHGMGIAILRLQRLFYSIMNTHGSIQTFLKCLSETTALVSFQFFQGC